MGQMLGNVTLLPNAKATPHPSELQFRSLLDKLPAGGYTCDSQGLITHFNDHAVKLSGRAPTLNDPVDRPQLGQIHEDSGLSMCGTA